MSGKKKNERGIFGMLKKKSVLFTFNPRQGDECSSDSEDSDYFPGRHSTDEDDVESIVNKQKLKAAKKRVKKAASHVPRKQSKRSGKGFTSDMENEATTNRTTGRLPPEILLRIFIYGAQSEGIIKFLPRVSRVCKEWHDTASDPSLMKYLDLSTSEGGVKLSKQRLEKLQSSRDLSQCQGLSLAGQDKLSVSHVKTLLSQTPSLSSVDFRGCQVNSDLLKAFPELCPNLERIDLSHLAPSSSASLPYVSLESLVKAFGPKLIELRLSGISSLDTKMEVMMKAIIRYCPIIEELDLSRPSWKTMNFIKHELDIQELAKACPQLTELRLDGHNFVNSGEHPSPLQCLKIFSQASQVWNPSDRAILYCIFSKNELSELNISQTNLKLSKINTSSSSVLSVKTLKLSNMEWDSEDVQELSDCLSCWSGTIEMLDLSGNKRESFNDEFSFFSQPSLCASASLQTINLSNSVVNSKNVLNIVKNCKSLRIVDLTACRELPRGCKRVFHCIEFPDLIQCLSLCIKNLK